MQAVAQDLSECNMQMLAAYFAKQHPPLPNAQTPPAPDLVAAGWHLAETGDGANMPACGRRPRKRRTLPGYCR